MRKETKKILWTSCIALGLFLAASPFLISHAQKNTETRNVQEEQSSEARAEVAKSVVGGLFLETLSVSEPSWSLDKAGFHKRGLHNAFTYLSMSLKKGDKLAAVGISEHDSPDAADEQFGGPTTRSYGVSVPFNKYGDKGDKLIGQNGDLMAIRFRKGNFFVAIWNRDQKTAESFAAYTLKSLGDAGVK